MANATRDMFQKPESTSLDFQKGLKENISDTSYQVERAVRSAGESIGAMGSNIANSTTKYLNTGRDYVKENPAKGVAIAAAAGAVVGSLLVFSMRRKH